MNHSKAIIIGIKPTDQHQYIKDVYQKFAGNETKIIPISSFIKNTGKVISLLKKAGRDEEIEDPNRRA